MWATDHRLVWADVQVNPIPEPSSLTLLGVAFVVLARSRFGRMRGKAVD